MFTIMGATGQIGTLVAQRLLSLGHPVRALGRTLHSLKPLVDLGATGIVVCGDDREELISSFAGSRAILSALPLPHRCVDDRGFQDRMSQNIIRAVQAAGIERVVNLSVIGAHRPDASGLLGSMRDHEQRLDRLPGIGLVHLRVSFLMENFLHCLPTMRRLGVLAAPFSPDARVPMVAARDVAGVAAGLLTGPDLRDRGVCYALGPRDVTLREASAAIGRALGFPILRCVEFHRDAYELLLIEAGMSPLAAGMVADLVCAFGDGGDWASRRPEVAEPTTIEDFAADLARA